MISRGLIAILDQIGFFPLPEDCIYIPVPTKFEPLWVWLWKMFPPRFPRNIFPRKQNKGWRRFLGSTPREPKPNPQEILFAGELEPVIP